MHRTSTSTCATVNSPTKSNATPNRAAEQDKTSCVYLSMAVSAQQLQPGPARSRSFVNRCGVPQLYRLRFHSWHLGMLKDLLHVLVLLVTAVAEALGHATACGNLFQHESFSDRGLPRARSRGISECLFMGMSLLKL